jgi:hypothetical protein
VHQRDDDIVLIADDAVSITILGNTDAERITPVFGNGCGSLLSLAFNIYCTVAREFEERRENY